MNSPDSFLGDQLFLFALFTTVFVYLLYPLVLFVLNLFYGTQKTSNGNRLPKISIVIPTYNEVFVIESKLTALLDISYPKELYEIIVVDSKSSDGTCEIVKKFEDKGVILLQQEKRLGKASAINFALKKCNGDIIVLSDANSVFGPDVLNQLVPRLRDDVGGIQPRIRPHHNSTSWHKLFHWVHHVFKTLESNVDSVFFASGKLFAFRKTFVTEINEDTAADDLEIALTIRKKCRVKYAPDIEVVEKTPATEAETRIQRVRRAFGVLQSMRRNSIFLFNPKYGAYGLVIFPTHFLQMTLLPFMIFYLAIITMIRIILIVGHLDATSLFLAGTFICILFCLLLLSRKIRTISSIGYKFLATQFYIILAIIDLLRGKSYRVWEKVSSTRESLS